MDQKSISFNIFDNLNRFVDCFRINLDGFDESEKDDSSDSNQSVRRKKYVAVSEVDGYFLSVFTRLLKQSNFYREMVISNFSNLSKNSVDSDIFVKFDLVKPKLEILDYSWNDRISYLITERKELEHAMSWLSTLGGAFSALGDNFEKCAKVAGKISIEQFKIAFRLGDPPLVARCKLYMALSLIQLGQLSIAKILIQNQYEVAKNTDDVRLQNMCKGIWAKLQYVYKQKMLLKKKY